MPDLFYTSGQAARELGVSPSAIRALCASGSVEAKTTPGGQYRIPKSVVERLKRDGLPPVPRQLPGGSSRPARSRHGHAALLADPSEDAVAAADEVVVLENEVRGLGLRRQREEALDWFRDRRQGEAERQAEQERQTREQREAREREARRREWLDKWTEHALALIPWDAPADTRLDVAEAVRNTLDSGDPSQPDTLTGRLVDAAVARGLAAWRRTTEVERAIERASDSLPWAMRHDSSWKYRATRAASEAIAKLRAGASLNEMEAAASLALKPLVAEYEHRKCCNEAIEGVWRLLPGGTSGEWEEGKEALREALPALPIGASQKQFEAACQSALESIRAAIAERQGREMREDVIRSVNIRLPWGMSSEATEEALTEVREALAELPEGTPRSELDAAVDRIIEQYKADHEREQNKQRLIEAGLVEIYSYLLKLEKEWEFDKSAWTLELDLKRAIGEALQDELGGDESPEEVARVVRRLVREQLGL